MSSSAPKNRGRGNSVINAGGYRLLCAVGQELHGASVMAANTGGAVHSLLISRSFLSTATQSPSECPVCRSRRLGHVVNVFWACRILPLSASLPAQCRVGLVHEDTYFSDLDRLYR